MTTLPNNLGTLKSLNNDNKNFYYSLPELENQGYGKISRLPVTIRILLESLLRNLDGLNIKEDDIHNLAKWGEIKEGQVPFVVSRVLLQDFTGVPLLVDLAAMRDAVAKSGFDPKKIEPLVPVDLIIDHSVQVDRAGTEDSFLQNLEIEFQRNKERYTFLKWGQSSFDTLKIIPPGIGICHQVNLELLAQVVCSKEQLLFPDTLVGTDSHTTMVAGLGILGWGVGGIEAEAAMLGQPVVIPIPEVIGVHLSGELKEGVTATDLTLYITELLRKESVVGKFVEFFGPGASSLTVQDRATISNMSPEYGATVGFFPSDDKTLKYLKQTGRDEKHVKLVENYLKEQNLFGIPTIGDIDYTKTLQFDLASVRPSVAGPKRPQDRIDLLTLKSKFYDILQKPVLDGGYGKTKNDDIEIDIGAHFNPEKPHECGGKNSSDDNMEWSETEMVTNRPKTNAVVKPGYSGKTPHDVHLKNGSIVIAAITSCTNTSNPPVMIAAGLVAKKAVELGLKIKPYVKTSLAPGSRVVSDYLQKTDLQKYLDALGFNLVAYGCTTCIGNSGPLDEDIEKAIVDHDLVTASVLSGNRNFEARIHSQVKANFLMSPPLVVAFALAGKIDIDMGKEPLGTSHDGKEVFLKDIWPTSEEIEEAIEKIEPSMFQKRYANIYKDNPIWSGIASGSETLYPWDEKSSYIQLPPYFTDFSLDLPKIHNFENMRPLAIFGDSVTTDHISPAGAFSKDTEAGIYLMSLGIQPKDFNSYGSRRGNHNVMMRGTFANVRIKNIMAEGKEGGWTMLMPEKKSISIFEAYKEYSKRKTPLIIFAGKDYGMGSSRDWAAKGSDLLGVKVVVARSFERIHRTNLIGMGVLPLEFKPGVSSQSLKIDGSETFSLSDLKLEPNSEVTIEITRESGQREKINLISSLKTETEVEYYKNGGILPFVLRKILS